MSGQFFIKPCTPAEIEFYESTAAHLDFKYYVPGFVGVLSPGPNADMIPTADSVVAGSSSQLTGLLSANKAPTAPAHQEWTPSNGGALNTEYAIVLENITDGFQKPNVLDVKLGARLWADDAPLAKRQKLEKSAAESTSLPLGVRIAGMKTWQGIQAKEHNDLTLDGYRIYDKTYGRSLTVQTIQGGLEEYFFVNNGGITKPLAREVISRSLKDLQGLHKVLQNQESRMYSASLLFVYEGDGKALQAALDQERILESEISSSLEVLEEEDSESKSEEVLCFPKIQAIKLIDFAHAKWTPGEGPDENVLLGVGNVIKMLERLLE